MLGPYDGSIPTVRIELFFAPRALTLSRAFELVDGWIATGTLQLPRDVLRSIREIDKLFRAIIKRWGWQDIISPAGFEIIADRLEPHYKQYYLPFLRAVRAGQQDLDGDGQECADESAALVENIGQEANSSMSPDDGRKSVGESRRLWMCTWALGRIHPDRLLAELSSSYSSRRAIKQYALLARASRLLGVVEATSHPSNGGRDEENIPGPAAPAPAPAESVAAGADLPASDTDQAEVVPHAVGSSRGRLGNSTSFPRARGPEPSEAAGPGQAPPIVSAGPSKALELEQRVGDYLSHNPSARSPEIAKALRAAESSVRKTPAWKNRSKRRPPRSAGNTSVRERRLTEPMLANCPGASREPGDIVADREPLSDEQLERELLKNASPARRAEWDRMPEGKRAEILNLMRDQREDDRSSSGR